MKKKLLLILLGIVLALPSFAQDFTFSYYYEGHTLKYNVLDWDAKTVQTASGANIAGHYNSGNYVSGELIIPSTVEYGGEKYTVTHIGYLSFYDNDYLTDIIIPESVTGIGAYAFYYCSGLRSVTIPESVNRIGDYAFYRCSDLRSVTIPGSVTGIGNNAFYECSGLSSVTIPESVTSIGDNAFVLCEKLRNVYVNWTNPIDVTISNIFDYNTYTEGRLYAPENTFNAYTNSSWARFNNFTFGDKPAVKLTDGVFTYLVLEDSENNDALLWRGDYEEMTEASIPERFTDDRDSANPKRYYIKGIGYSAFLNCSNLKEVHFSQRSQITLISRSAFNRCSNLTTITLPETVTEIGSLAFSGCSKLSSVNIPEHVTTIGSSVFYGCEALTSVTFPENLTEIGPSAFYGCKALTSATFPDSVTSIRESAFAECTGLDSVTIPGSVTTIEDNAFHASMGLFLKTLTFLDSDKPLELGEKAFDSATTTYVGRNVNKKLLSYPYCYLRNLTFGNTVTNIPDEGWSDMKYLQEINFGNNITKIGKNAFSDCTSLKEVVLPPLLETVGTSAFEGDSELASIIMSSQVKTIGRYAFYDCTSMEEVILPPSVETIGVGAFSGCTSMKEVVLPPSVEYIGDSAFAGDSELASIIMGHKVKTIGEKAFDGCPASTISITAQTPPEAPNNVFSVYTGKLYLQGQKAVDAYYDAFTCWDRFDGVVMIEATEIKLDGASKIEGKPGDTFQLKATLMPENVTLPQVFWRSTNPDIATVDNTGLVTIHADLNEVLALAEDDGDSNTCNIIAESLYADGPVVELDIVRNNTTVINKIESDTNENTEINPALPMDVYDINGIQLSDSMENLTPGIYIVRQGKAVKKVAVK
ncbi:MAG: leucine-rich repeat protein [Muribaculaceae bacterium]|nr:leucine-rich repeat protein [Muribaculaceae bacterium]